MIWSPRWFPGTNLQDINLDWILKKVSALRGGRTGQYLYKKSDKDFDFGWKTGGGGGGGTSDYLDLDNKPSINNVELIGNKTAADLGLASASDIPVVPVQSVNGKTGVVVLSASDVGAYVKPESGIPKTDLSSALQTSLDKADTAYTKPESGIPKTDLSSAVQTSLDKADTALQAVPPTYRTAEAQDTIDAAQNTQIDARAKANEIAVVITGARPSIAVTAGQYVIVRNSTISGITDGLYTANSALSPSTDVSAANLTAVSGGGLNSVKIEFSTDATQLESKTIAANGYAEWTSVDISRAGKKAIAIVGINTNRSSALLCGFRLYSTTGTFYAFMKNISNADLLVNSAVCQILYINE